MSVTNLINTISYTSSGTVGPYSFTFPIVEGSDMVVKETDLAGNITTLDPSAYTVTAASGGFTNGGTVTLDTLCPLNWTVTLTRDTELTQESAFTENMPALYATFEAALDKLTMEVQDVVGGGIPDNIQALLDLKQDIVVGVSDIEIGYLDGVTSAIQTQLDEKQDFIGYSITSYSNNLSTAVTSIGSTVATLFIDAATTLDTGTTTVPKTLSIIVDSPGLIVQPGTSNLVILGPFQSNGYSFSGFSAGQVTGLNEATPEMFGAVGNGSTDDSTALSCALLAGKNVTADGTKTYLLSNIVIGDTTDTYPTISVSNTTVDLKGAVLKLKPASTWLLKISTSNFVNIGNFKLDMNNVANAKGVWQSGAWNAKIHDIESITANVAATSHDFYIDPGYASYYPGPLYRGSYISIWENISGTYFGIQGHASTHDITTTMFVNVSLTGPGKGTGNAFAIDSADYLRFYNPVIQGYLNAFSLSNCQLDGVDGGDVENVTNFITAGQLVTGFPMNGVHLSADNFLVGHLLQAGNDYTGSDITIKKDAATMHVDADSAAYCSYDLMVEGVSKAKITYTGTYLEIYSVTANVPLQLLDTGLWAYNNVYLPMPQVNGGVWCLFMYSTGGNRIGWSGTAPSTGSWAVGDVIYNTSVSAGGSPGWVYTGTGWKTMANVGA